MKNFEGAVAAITGAGSGMGRALAIRLASRGCHIAIADVMEEPLEETARLLGATRVNVSSHIVDVADRDRVFAFADEVNDRHGKVNMIFNNAGVSVTDEVRRMKWEDFEWLMNINFWGVVHGTRAFLPYLEQQQDAHIVNTSSIFGNIAVPSQSAYNASKFAVKGFTYALWAELRDSPVNVTCVQPGGVKTNIVRQSRYVPRDNEAPNRQEFEAMFEQVARLTPEQAAEQILKGVRRNRLRVLVGADARVAAWLERIAPVGYLNLMTRFMDRGD